MKKELIALAGLAATVTLGVAAPAMAEPVASVGGQFFSEYRAPLSGPAGASLAQKFGITRSFLTGKVKFDDTWSGVITLNTQGLTTSGAATATGASPDTNDALLNLAYVQASNWLYGGSTLQLGMVACPWSEYDLSQWGYRMLGLTPIHGGLSASPARVQAWDKGIKLSGNHFGMLSYAVGVFNGEGYRKDETDGQKTYEGRVTVTPLTGLDITGLYHRGNPTGTGVQDAMGGYLGYTSSFVRAGLGYTMTANQASSTATAANGSIMDVFAVVPFHQYLGLTTPLEVILRGDQIVPDTSASSTNTMETIAGLSFKPVPGVTFVLDDQMVTSNTSASSATTNTVLLHGAYTF